MDSKWTTFVDIVTVFWVVLFIVGLLGDPFNLVALTPSTAALIDQILLGFLAIFILDVIFLYLKVRNMQIFFRKY